MAFSTLYDSPALTELWRNLTLKNDEPHPSPPTPDLVRFRVPFGDALVLLDLFAGLLSEENGADRGGSGTGLGGGDGGRRVGRAGASDGAGMQGAGRVVGANAGNSAPLLADGPTLPTIHTADGHDGLAAVRRGATHHQQQDKTTTRRHDATPPPSPTTTSEPGRASSGRAASKGAGWGRCGRRSGRRDAGGWGQRHRRLRVRADPVGSTAFAVREIGVPALWHHADGARGTP